MKEGAILGKEHKTTDTTCPYCGEENDKAAGVLHDKAPEAGDLMVCMHCCNVVKYNEEGKVVKMTVQEFEKAVSQHRLAALVGAMKLANQLVEIIESEDDDREPKPNRLN